MRTFTIVLACCIIDVYTRGDQSSLDDHYKKSAIAALLFSVNPSPALVRHTANVLRSSAPLLQTSLDQSRTMGESRDEVAGLASRQVPKAAAAAPTILVQGGTLKTWSYASPAVDRVQVFLTTEGRPLDADIELWQGPDNTPMKMRVYSEDGDVRPFNAVIETPQAPNTVAIRNIGQIEFPLAANLVANDVDEPLSDFFATSMTVQGGSLKTFPFEANVQSVEIMLKTDGRPLNARIELLQGPNNNKQVIELYADDGLSRPFFAIIDTVGSGNVIRIVNTAPIEFPMIASVQPHAIDDSVSLVDAVIGGN